MDFFPIICLREGEEERKKKRCVGGGVENGGRKEERDGQKEKMYRFSSQRF